MQSFCSCKLICDTISISHLFIEGRLTCCGQVMPYSAMELCQRWFRQWIVAWRRQDITWASARLSWVSASAMQLKVISHGMFKIFILNMSLNIPNFSSQPYLPGASELTDTCMSFWRLTVKKVYSVQKVHYVPKSLRWHHNGRDGVSNHQPHDCLLNHLFTRRSKKTSNPRVTGLCAGNSPGTGEFPHKWPVTLKMFPFHDVIIVRYIP